MPPPRSRRPTTAIALGGGRGSLRPRFHASSTPRSGGDRAALQSAMFLFLLRQPRSTNRSLQFPGVAPMVRRPPTLGRRWGCPAVVMAGEKGDETHLPTQCDQEDAHPRLPRADGHQGRPRRVEPSALQRTQEVGCNEVEEVGDAQTGAAQAGHASPSGSAPLPLRGPATFPKACRLRKRQSFLHVQATGRRWSGRFLTFLRSASSSPNTRLGLTVSRKVGNAVARNSVKRKLRELWRHHRGSWPVAMDVVIVARPNAASATWDELFSDLQRFFGRCRDEEART